MQNGRLYVALLVCSLVTFPLYSYGDPYEQDEWGYESNTDDNTAYYSDDQSSTVETYHPPRHYVNDDYNQSNQNSGRQYTNTPQRQYTNNPPRRVARHEPSKLFARLPEHITAPGEKLIIVDPSVHAWGAYSASGTLVRQGLATAGASWCDDIDRPCHTTVGSFRIASLGD